MAFEEKFDVLMRTIVTVRRIELDFHLSAILGRLKPFKVGQAVNFKLKPTGASTEIVAMSVK